MTTTYNPKQILIALGTHIASGYAEDSFVEVAPNGDGVATKVGCDGEVVRSINPDETYNIKLVLLHGSETGKYLQNRYDMDIATGNGMFPLTIKDQKGGTLFTAQEAWVSAPAARGYGREAGNEEWNIHTGKGKIKLS